MSELVTAQIPSRRRMFDVRWWHIAVVFLVAYVPRVFNIGRVENFLDDRWTNVPAAFNYANFGLIGPDNWFTQPSKHLFMYWSLSIFGNDPVGWAMRQVVFGSIVVVLTYLLARRLFRAHFPAIVSAALVAFDPLSISFSRASSEDPLATVFILAALLCWTKAVQEGRDRDWMLAGALIGIASATRWYALLIALLMFAIALFARRRDGVGALVKTGVQLSVVPLAAYLAWFWPWMARGYSISELWALQLDSYLVQQSGAYPTFDQALAPLTGPSGWFVRWMGVGTSSGTGTYTAIMNDPVLWALFVPAIAYVAFIAFRRGLPELWLLAATFAVLYVFFVAVDRPIYLYSALPIVPLGFMAVGYASCRLLRRWSTVFLAVALAWSLYLYPLTSAVSVPVAPYAWLLGHVGLGAR